MKKFLSVFSMVFVLLTIILGVVFLTVGSIFILPIYLNYLGVIAGWAVPLWMLIAVSLTYSLIIYFEEYA